MRIDAGQHMRLGQHMKLAPRMIQSMEILQMPAAALEERIEQELSSNPTLELREAGADPREIKAELAQEHRDATEGERPLVVDDDGRGGAKDHADDFERLSNFSETFGESFAGNTYESDDYRPSYSRASYDGERDAKMDAMANTAARPASLADQLLDQWSLVETTPDILKAGEFLLGFIDDDGYLRTDRQTLLNQAPPGITGRDLDAAVDLIQRSVEPVGIGAADLRECLLLQIDAKVRQLLADDECDENVNMNEDADGQDDADSGVNASQPLRVERLLVSDYLKDIEVNRLPKIAKQIGLPIERIKRAILNLRQFHPHPGRLLVTDTPMAIRPDAIVEFDDDADCYSVRLTSGRLPALQINDAYRKMARDSTVEKRTREFVNNNLRSARWLLDAIQQRNHTLLRVIGVVVEAQRDFFDQGPQSLKPLPMTLVAEQLGIHVATVSRAVSEKYLQTPRGIFPLRMFFSGGTETQSGQSMSWQAVQAKLQELIEAEDKANPLSDDELVDELKKHGIEIARRTVAKYRKQLHIPPARQRKQF
jgi:RNA polymerase sigma-54 factor